MNQTILLTGATGQLGRSFSEAAIKAGYNLVLVARTESTLIEAKKALDILQPGKSIIAPADICCPEDVVRAFNLAVGTFGAINIVIHAAAIAAKGSVIASELAVAESILQTNAIGSLTISKMAASFLKRFGGGHIVNVASTVGLCPMPLFSLYGMSKAAQIYLTKVTALELANDNIQVNALCPGIINNDMLDGWLNTEQGINYQDKLPKYSITSADQVTETLLWLIKAPNMALSGNVISPDGGFQYFSNQSKC